MAAVLVVEGDRSIRRLMCELLVIEGYVVQSVEHGGPALDILRSTGLRFVVLLDLIMPGMNGEDFLEAVVADEALATRHAYVVVSAAISVATEGRVLAMREWLHAPFIPIPFLSDQLLSVVKAAAATLE